MSIYLIIALVTLGFTGILVFEGIVDTGCVEAKTIVVDINGNGNYTTIQAAIDNASAGDTVRIWNGTYIENVVINKTLSIIGNGSVNATVEGVWAVRDKDTFHISADWVNISGLSIECVSDRDYPYYDAAIGLHGVHHCQIYDNFIGWSHYGLHLDNSTNNMIENNIIERIYDIGIISRFSDINTYNNNIFQDNFNYNLYFVNTSNNNVRNNTIKVKKIIFLRI